MSTSTTFVTLALTHGADDSPQKWDWAELIEAPVDVTGHARLDAAAPMFPAGAGPMNRAELEALGVVRGDALAVVVAVDWLTILDLALPRGPLSTLDEFLASRVSCTPVERDTLRSSPLGLFGDRGILVLLEATIAQGETR